LTLNLTVHTNTNTMKPIEIELKSRQVGPLLQFVFKEWLRRWLGGGGWLRSVAQRGGSEGWLSGVAGFVV
jgi:hypothetical protein